MEEKPIFILLYGLPGSGKTTLAKHFCEAKPSFKFIELTNVQKNYQHHIRISMQHRNTITEGVFTKLERRTKIINMALKTHRVLCVYVHEDFKVLKDRRDMMNIPRYTELYQEMEVFVDDKIHVSILNKTIDDRINKLEELIEGM